MKLQLQEKKLQFQDIKSRDMNSLLGKIKLQLWACVTFLVCICLPLVFSVLDFLFVVLFLDF